jgi:DnaJ-class molecular chaperone
MAEGSDSESEEEAGIEENYYSILNVRKEAPKEEINAAFRQLSRLYHPDRHADPKQKKKVTTFSFMSISVRYHVQNVSL